LQSQAIDAVFFRLGLRPRPQALGIHWESNATYGADRPLRHGLSYFLSRHNATTPIWLDRLQLIPNPKFNLTAAPGTAGEWLVFKDRPFTGPVRIAAKQQS
jgi:hypothetical protein